MKSFKLVLLAVIALTMGTACTRIESGHSGVRVNWNGTVEPTELGVGYHQTIIGDVRKYVSNEITYNLDNLHPQTKDKTLLSDMDLTYNYEVNPSSIADLYVKFKGRDYHDEKTGENYPMALYVTNVVQTATTDVIAQYDALDANENRDAIRVQIKARIDKILEEEKINDVIKVKQVFIKNLSIDPKLLDSARAVITAQNDLKAKSYEVQTAAKEADRLKAVAGIGGANLEVMKIQIQKDMVAALRENKNAIYVVPTNMTSLMFGK
jgi:regulator of protease activity HflC (stomatin/prohibitin superfamily)